MNDFIDLAALRNCVDALEALLQEPFPGLASWREMFSGRVREFYSITGLDFDSLPIPDPAVALVEGSKPR